MIKRLLLFCIITVMSIGIAVAGPDLACDPQEGVEHYVLEFPALPFTVVIMAEADGSLRYDLATWTYGGGWFDGVAKSESSYAVTDVTTGVTTTSTVTSLGAPFKLKIPMNIKPKNYIIK